MSEEFDATEAAIHLGITPELLYHYVRYGAKGRNSRRLTCVPGSGARRFTKAALDDYDAWLSEPWAAAGAPRQDPPKGVRDYLKVESGGICPCCRLGGPFDDAHIEEWSRSRSNHHHNLLRLCCTCHKRYDRREIPRAEIEQLKLDAIARVQERIRRRPVPQWPLPSAPPVAPSFYGRGTELTKTVEALRSQPSLCVMGVGGIGKTQLVLRALREAATGRPTIWIGIDTLGGSVSLGDMLLARAKSHGVRFRDGRPLFDDVRACLVFDGIERVADRRDEALDLIERLLADYSDTLVVITSQVMLSSLDFAETLRLGPIDDAAAIAILDNRPASSSMDVLLRFADGHPLTLRLLKVLLRHYGEARIVEDELARLGASAVADPQRLSQSTATSLMTCLELAYAQLSAVGRGLLWIVSSSPAGFRPGLHDLRMLAGSDAAIAVAGLRSWNFIDEQSDPSFEPGAPPHTVLAMLSPVRAFVRARAADDNTVLWDDVSLRFVESQAILSTFIQNGILRGGKI
ncbi:hypothetical protein NS228_23845 [Methylobacterium indicum]|uniref:HNH endonuclease n=1 Tax=Methylobacterium indicum TaxID=1775910 RepID=UPI000733D9F0|nr:HNH endonuclease [Methylobacterium indicum]KTS25897.1 hypothetical protein NS229_18890 [Methylobacterium indicum]KTS30706.1 hypothetical protein NS228_23845 [Methylobacterium indicum]KTS52510.1 hypothetical protein NS230_09430 [Methylobacterium indicum]